MGFSEVDLLGVQFGPVDERPRRMPPIEHALELHLDFCATTVWYN